MKSRYAETHFSREHRFAIGIDRKTGGYYLAIPVSNGVVNYDEQHHITSQQYEAFSSDLTSALPFVEGCRRRQYDEQLIYPPSDRRGSPV
ncbi:hypothetical protein [Mycolicibacterium litorale]|uniref:hypothetical protein n=1 Tax=Mycolicibacterium litorale TaxID=758802 RepID=UPI001626369B|nr:hypothetical protein [Mycolicibacterium litorale]